MGRNPLAALITWALSTFYIQVKMFLGFPFSCLVCVHFGSYILLNRFWRGQKCASNLSTFDSMMIILRLWNCKTVCTATSWNPFWRSILDFMNLPFHEKAHLTKIHCYQFEYFENILWKTLVVLEYKNAPQENLSPMVIGYKPTNTYLV